MPPLSSFKEELDELHGFPPKAGPDAVFVIWEDPGAMTMDSSVEAALPMLSASPREGVDEAKGFSSRA